MQSAMHLRNCLHFIYTLYTLYICTGCELYHPANLQHGVECLAGGAVEVAQRDGGQPLGDRLGDAHPPAAPAHLNHLQIIYLFNPIIA